MEATTAIRDHVLNPTSVYSKIESWDSVLGNDEPSSTSWDVSFLNPKNRIDSLTPPTHTSWRIDGADPEGTRFFAYPLSALGRPPLRIDVYIPGQQDHAPSLRRVLRSTIIPFVRRDRVAEIELSVHLQRALDRWVERTPGFEALYQSMPFGSRVVVNEIKASLDEVEIHLVPVYEVEQHWFSVKALRLMWAEAVGEEGWPEVLDINALQMVSQPHESITLVKILAHGEDTVLVFKSLVQDVKYMYHELKMLLTVPEHPNVIGKPLYLVTKKCRFGGKTGVCGFILPYFSCWNLGRVLEASSVKFEESNITVPISLQTRLRWARQITLAVMHIGESPMGFYPDLKPDNIMISVGADQALDAILIDLEQRGGWYSWSPPEVRYIEYLEYIAVLASSPSVRGENLALLRSLSPGWKLPTQKDRYRDIGHGFSAAWEMLEGNLEREKAQVFMLGKLLWCLFEGMSSVNCGIGFDMFREQMSGQRSFPEFVDTPKELRDCVRSCVAGAPELEGRRRSIVRVGMKYYPVERTGKGPEVLDETTPCQTHDAAVEWWREEVKSAKMFAEQTVKERGENNVMGVDLSMLSQVRKHVSQRPSLQEILQSIEDAEGLYGKSA